MISSSSKLKIHVLPQSIDTYLGTNEDAVDDIAEDNSLSGEWYNVKAKV